MKKVSCTSFLFLSLFTLSFVLSCSSRQFTKGEYDEVDTVRLLDDKFNENDLKLLSQEMADSLLKSGALTARASKSVLQMERIRNKTHEHIDTKSISDSIRTGLLKTGRVYFSNKEEREVRDEEIDYQNKSGRIRKDTRKSGSRGVGADYMISGDLISNVQEVGSRKLVFYRLTLNMTDLESGLIVWSDEKPIRKRYKKKSVGM